MFGYNSVIFVKVKVFCKPVITFCKLETGNQLILLVVKHAASLYVWLIFNLLECLSYKQF